jgi:hypothetical protein
MGAEWIGLLDPLDTFMHIINLFSAAFSAGLSSTHCWKVLSLPREQAGQDCHPSKSKSRMSHCSENILQSRRGDGGNEAMFGSRNEDRRSTFKLPAPLHIL